MATDERYEPQDIEQLMQEKSFTALLPDERSFVLKHLADEAEYEQVRAMMLAIQSSIGDEDIVAPSPGLRRELIATFKEEKKSGYRYWLNVIGGWLIPNRTGDLRPVYRLALIAGLIGITWFTVNQWESLGQQDQLAELKDISPSAQEQSTNEPSESATNKGLEEQVETSQPALGNNDYNPVIDVVEVEAEANFDLRENTTEPTPPTALADVPAAAADNFGDIALEDAEELEPATVKDLTEDFGNFADAEEKMADEVVKSQPTIANEVHSTISRADNASAGRMVAKENLEVRKKVDNAISRNSRNLAQDGQLIGLLVQAY